MINEDELFEAHDEGLQPSEPTPPESNPVKTIEAWRDELKTAGWLWAGMKAGKNWPIGKEVTRAEYDAALEWAANVECR